MQTESSEILEFVVGDWRVTQVHGKKVVHAWYVLKFATEQCSLQFEYFQRLQPVHGPKSVSGDLSITEIKLLEIR